MIRRWTFVLAALLFGFTASIRALPQLEPGDQVLGGILVRDPERGVCLVGNPGSMSMFLLPVKAAATNLELQPLLEKAAIPLPEPLEPGMGTMVRLTGVLVEEDPEPVLHVTEIVGLPGMEFSQQEMRAHFQRIFAPALEEQDQPTLQALNLLRKNGYLAKIVTLLLVK